MTPNETNLTIQTLQQTIETLTKRNMLLEAQSKLWEKPSRPPEAGVEQLTLDTILDIFMEQSGMMQRLLNVALQTAKQQPIKGMQAMVVNRMIFEAAIQALCWYLFSREHGYDISVLHGMDPVKLNAILKERYPNGGMELGQMPAAMPTHTKS